MKTGMAIFRDKSKTLVKLQRPTAVKLLFKNSHVKFTVSFFVQILITEVLHWNPIENEVLNVQIKTVRTKMKL